jgi:hypothetical protein
MRIRPQSSWNSVSFSKTPSSGHLSGIEIYITGFQPYLGKVWRNTYYCISVTSEGDEFCGQGDFEGSVSSH